MNQYRILKQLSTAYAIRFVTNALTARMQELQFGGDVDSPTELAEMHASSAGLKGFCCNAASVGIEELRKCCGGAGYLMASGIAALEVIIPHHETFRNTTQPPYSSTKGRVI